MTRRATLFLLTLIVGLLCGCFKDYPGDPVPDPNATRQKPAASSGSAEGSSGAVRPPTVPAPQREGEHAFSFYTVGTRIQTCRRVPDLDGGKSSGAGTGVQALACYAS